MENPIALKVPLYKNKTIHIEECKDTEFYDKVHFHEEFQLTHIINGTGRLIVGQDSYSFTSGDTYLFGRNLPHAFKKDTKCPSLGSKIKTHSFSVFFNGDRLVAFLNQLAETSSIQELLSASYVGLNLNKKQCSGILVKLKRLQRLNDFEKIMELLYIFEDISKCTTHIALTTPEIASLNFDEYGVGKMKAIFNFIELNYSKKISLTYIASHFGMNPSSFCRFFKSRTLMTFSQFLIEIRVAKACELIRKGAHNATETCFESGFTNLSNFHRQFKNVMGMTPTQYKESVSTFFA